VCDSGHAFAYAVLFQPDERCAGVVFLKEGPCEGWQKLVAGGGSGNAVMGHVFVRVGPKLSTLVEPPPPNAVNLDEAFPEFEAEAAVRMEPPPPDTMSLGRVFSLSVSLADVFRVRQFLVNGGSARTQVIIGRGINGAPLEAICANCPSTFQRKKMRIEFEGGSYWRLRSADDAVAIVKLLLLAGAKRDARVVRWLYDNAAASQGKQAVMKVLDPAFYSEGEVKKKKKKKAASAVPAAGAGAAAAGGDGWRSQKDGPVKRQPSNVLLGGRRAGGKKQSSGNLTPEEEERRRYEEAQAALARPVKPIPLIPDEPDDREPDSDDLEEESSEEEERAVPVVVPSPTRAVASAPRRALPEPEPEVEPEEQSGESQEEEPLEGAKADDTAFENIEDIMSEIEQQHVRDSGSAHGSTVEELLPSDVLSASDAANESVIDWEGVETDVVCELGEEVSEAAEREKEKQWKRPPSMLFTITRK
jgi:hypothetical protein